MDIQIVSAVALLQCICLALALGFRLGMTAISALSASRTSNREQDPS